MKKTGFLLMLFCLLITGLAHEFWLEPQQFLYSRGEEVNIRFRVGEHFAGDNWSGNRDRVQLLKLYYADITDDVSQQLSQESGDSLQFSLFEEGTAMVCFQSANSFIELEPEKFLAYLTEDGLQNAIDYRTQHQETDSTGKEWYQRSVKTLVQIGIAKTNVYSKRSSLPLDIVPLSHPYALTQEDSVSFRIFFSDSLLVNHKIRVWHKLAGTVTEYALQSDESGTIRLPVQPKGEWMVSCVHMVRLEADPKAQWQSYWGSFTWGYTGRSITKASSR